MAFLFLPLLTARKALVQNEISIHCQEKEVVAHMHYIGIAIQVWYPLDGRGHAAAKSSPTRRSLRLSKP